MKTNVKKTIEDILRVGNLPGAAAKGLFPIFSENDK